MASKNSHVPIILAIVLAVAVVTVVVVTYTMKQSPRQVACTQEAMVCPDGTSVGRTGPNCEFTPCSTTAPVPLPVDCSGADGACPGGYTCIQRCGPPVARENDPAPGYYCELSSVASQPRMCPICLASNALIAMVAHTYHRVGRRVHARLRRPLKTIRFAFPAPCAPSARH